MADYVGALDQGTTSTRFMIFDHGGQVVAIDQKEHEQIFPKPGWVEHDPAEIWTRTTEVIEGALQKANLAASDLAAVGITNQRETDRRVGPRHRRADPQRARLAGHAADRASSTSSRPTAVRTASARRPGCRSRRTSRARRFAGSSTTSTAPASGPRRAS